MKTTAETTPKILQARHYKDCVENRGLDPQWVSANCYSVTANEATQRLGYTAQSDGMWLEGCNHQSQFKPDKPWKLEGDKGKAPKYRSPTGEYDAMLPTHPTDSHYWDDIEALKERAFNIDGHPCLVVTEGFFKAIAGCANGIPTIALLGVEMGLTSGKADLQGKRYLVPALERYAEAGFGFIFSFDADCSSNSAVTYAQRKVLHQLRLFTASLFIATGLWEVSEGKGMDDYIQAQGAERFKREVLGKAVDIESWEKQFQQAEKTQRPAPLPDPVILAAELVERYRNRLAWNNEIAKWMRYEAESEGVWAEESNEALEGVIQSELDTDPRTTGKYGYSLVNNIIKLMRGRLLVRHWDEQPRLLPLQDGVLNLSSMQLLPHAPGYRLTWCLPYQWKARTVGCIPIQEWLLEAMKGDRLLVEVLQAYLNALVTGRVDLQRYLECLGAGGTGKGTFMRLAEALVGQENVHATTFKQLEQNRFETAAIYKKRLLLITDAERYGGEVSQLKAITGQDRIRYERKNVQQSRGFTPTCMVIVAANEAVQSADYTSGLERRRLTVPFVNQIKPEERRDLDAEFKIYVPGLLAWVLEMPDERVTALVRNTSSSVPALARWKAETLIETNPLAEWLDFCIVHSPGIKTQVGVAKRDKSPDSPTAYQFVTCWLYASYCEYSTAVGNRAISQRRFSSLLHDLCVNQLNLEGVSKGRNRDGAYFQGLIIRQEGDNRPHPITGKLTLVTLAGDESQRKLTNFDGNVMHCDGNVTAETPAGDECDGCDGFFLIHPQSAAEKAVENFSKSEAENAGKIENPSHPSHSSPAGVSAVTLPSPIHHESSPDSSPAVVTPPRIKVGVGVLVDYSGTTAKIVGWEKGARRIQLEVGGRLLPSTVSISQLKPLPAE